MFENLFSESKDSVNKLLRHAEVSSILLSTAQFDDLHKEKRLDASHHENRCPENPPVGIYCCKQV
jgi:hypothetical protein